MRPAERRLAYVQGLMIAGAFAGAAFIPSDAEPTPATTVALVGLGVSTIFFRVQLNEFAISSASLAVILAAVLGGPMLAVGIGAGSVLLESLRSRIEFKLLLTNVWIYWLLGLVSSAGMELVRREAESLSGGLALGRVRRIDRG
jgi:hypothetical protein